MSNQKILFSTIAIIILGALGVLAYKSIQSNSEDYSSITSFEDCADAGYPIMESHPRQCRTPDGKLYVEEIENDPNTARASGGCYIGGCSQEICSDQQDAVSTCIYKPEFACYKGESCGRQANGQCGWTPNVGLSACLDIDYNEIVK